MISPGRLKGAMWGLAALAAAAPGAVRAQSAPQPAEVIIVAPTPLSGARLDADKLPGTVEILGAGDFAHAGSLSAVDALQQRAPGVSLSDTQGNSFTRDLDFRGFKASSLQGTPEGLAVYMNGARLNETFGDTVNWDLIPETAISRAELFTASPAFGLNALGGAVSLTMKTGLDTHGGQAQIEGGAFGRVNGSAEYGLSKGPWSAYLAVDGGREDGWRIASRSSVARVYGDIGWKDGPGELHLTFNGGRNTLGVVGPAPVDLLSKTLSAVYTYPQTTRNEVAQVGLNGRYALADGWSVQGALNARLFSQQHVDGNDGNFEGCTRSASNPLFGTLCAQDDAFPAPIRPAASAFQILNAAGVPVGCPPLVSGQNKLCNGIAYGTIDRTRTNAGSFGATIQATRDGKLLGHGNLFALGASYDAGWGRFSSSSELDIVQPDLSVAPTAGIPGMGQIIHTAGYVSYGSVEALTDTRYGGIYATDTFDVTPALSLTVSGRMNMARVALTDLSGHSPDLTGTHTFDRFNPAIGLAYKATGRVTVYGGYSEANRAPTALELGCSNPLKPCLLENALVADPPLNQVVAKTWEGGVRGRATMAGGRETWRLGLFHTNLDNDIVALASALQGRGAYANVPRTQRQGVEASVDYSGSSWRAYLGYSYVQATYQFTGSYASPNSPFADANGNVAVKAGNVIGGQPAHRFKAGVDKDLTSALTVGADMVAFGQQFYAGDESNQDKPMAAYWLLNLHGAYQVTPRLALFARIDNVLDRRDPSYGTYFGTDGTVNIKPNPLPANPDPHTVTPSQPRAFMIGLHANW